MFACHLKDHLKPTSIDCPEAQSLLAMQGRLMASQLAEARQLGQHVQATLLPHVEQLLLVDFPLRSGSAVDSLDLGMGFKLDEVSVSLKVAHFE